MAWIKMRTDLGDDPAVVMMAAALRMSEDEVVGKLHRLWSWADRHTKDGFAPAITIAWIDRYVGRKGFSDAMVLAQWLEVTPTGIRIPKFERHNGDSAKSRADATERQRRSRECHEKGVTPVTESCDSGHEKSVTREDKRREEKKNKGADFVRPEWLEAGLWDDYLAMRARIRKPATDRAKALIVRELERLQAEGHAPAAVLEESIKNSWQDVYPLKTRAATDQFKGAL